MAEEIIAAALEGAGATNGDIQAALVAMQPDGTVLAMVGGRSYEESEYNRAVQAQRQPGSTFKLFVYFAALRNGYAPDDPIEDAPVEIDGWSPENFAGEYYGTVTLADAFARSLNAATVRLAQDVGVDEVVDAAKFLGIDAPLRAHPSLSLGTSEITLLDLTAAYASVAAGTAPIEPTGVAGYGDLDQQRLLAPGPPAQPRQSLQPYQGPLIELLRGVVEHGTGRGAALDGFAAGKTGTSENFRDAWFVGFTEDLVAGVWVGNDNSEPMDEMTGGKLPAEIWKAFMSEASQILGKEPQPADPSGDEPMATLEADDGSDHVTPDTHADAPVFGSDAGETSIVIDRQPEPRAEPRVVDRGSNISVFEVPEQEPERAEPSASEAQSADLSEESELEDQGYVEVLQTEPSPSAAGLTIQCDYEACSSAYRSFRRSDCSYQPYRGPRKLCERGATASVASDDLNGEVELDTLEQGSADDEQTTFVRGETSTAPQCNYDACSRAYDSFRPSDCTFQPYRGSRKLCEK